MPGPRPDDDIVIPAQDVVDQAIAAAARVGADDCIVLVEEASHADVRFALNTTTTNGVTRDRTVTTIILDGKDSPAVGVARQSGAVDVGAMVAAALTDAKGSSPADDAFPLFDPSTTPATTYDSAPALTDLSALTHVLAGLAPAFAEAKTRDVNIAGFAEHNIDTLYLGTSTGIRLAHAQTTGAVQLSALSADGSHTAWAGTGQIDDDFGALVDGIWRRLDWGRTRHALDAGRYEVILPPSAIADLMASLNFYSLGGQDAEDGRTVFSAPGGGTRIGDTLSPTPFTLRSDPAEPALECLPFVAVGSSTSESSVFDNGLPLGRTDWIHQGKLTNLRYHRAGAARSGVPAAPYIDNLVLRSDTASGSVDDMVARTERGLLLTCLWYIREVDPITLLMTGLTRDGVYVIEDGQVVGSANNFRFNESPIDLLARTTEVSDSVRTLGREFGEYLNRTIMPALRIPDFNMSSVSQAS
jgi:predicted Zn-dependent protease